MYVFFFNDTATTEIYTLSLHDALPIFGRTANRSRQQMADPPLQHLVGRQPDRVTDALGLQQLVDLWLGKRSIGAEVQRSEEHTSELQSRQYLVCRLLLEKKKHTSLTFY